MELMELLTVAEARDRFLKALPPGALRVEEVEPAAAVGRPLARPVAVPGGELPAGAPVGPWAAALLASAGLGRVPVRSRPRVAVISTGDEIVDPVDEPAPGQIRDTNSYAVAAAVEADGGEPWNLGVIPDRLDRIEEGLHRAMSADLILISGGSSVGMRDNTAKAIAALGSPGILVHGVALKPGKPTILAVAEGKPVIGLPGHPVSAMLVYHLFARPALRHLLGWRAPSEAPLTVRARLARNLSSAQGLEEYLRVQLEERDGELWAVPILGKSGLLTTMVRADGLLGIPRLREGHAQGEWVDVEVMEG